jgi:hypothetical protein
MIASIVTGGGRALLALFLACTDNIGHPQRTAGDVVDA